MSQRAFRFWITILITCFTILFYCLTLLLIFHRGLDLPTPQITYQQYTKAKEILEEDLHENPCWFTDQEFKNYIEKDFNLKFYIYTESDLKGNYNGKTYPVTRTIVIDNELNGYGYCKTFVHETIHLKHMVANERYVCFETFKYLYESDDLHDVGVWYGYRQVVNGHYLAEYNISDLVVDYLTKE